MSDDFEPIEFESDGEDMDDEEGGDDLTRQIMDCVYEGDEYKLRDPAKALQYFEKARELDLGREDQNSNQAFAFKNLEDIVILCSRLGQLDLLLRRHEELLKLIGHVTSNEAAKAIDTILNCVVTAAPNQAQHIYNKTLDALKTNNHHRLWFNTAVSLAKLHLELKEWHSLSEQIEDLYKSCQLPNGADDIAGEASKLLEIYALDFQLCTATKNSTRMKLIYPKTMHLTPAVAMPQTLAVIREHVGKMLLSEKKWSLAYHEFFEAFKHYQVIANGPSAVIMLCYAALSNMIALSKIDCFSAREAKVYEEDPQVRVMRRVQTAYDEGDLAELEKILEDRACPLTADPVFNDCQQDLVRAARLKVMKSLLQPYKTVTLLYLASEMRVTTKDIIYLLIKLTGTSYCVSIDTIRGVVTTQTDSDSMPLMEKWMEPLRTLKRMATNVVLQ